MNSMSPADKTAFILCLFFLLGNIALAVLLFSGYFGGKIIIGVGPITTAGLLIWMAVRIWRQSRPSRPPTLPH